MILIRWVRAVVTHGDRGIGAATGQQRRSGGRAALHGFGNHRGNGTGEIGRNRQRMGIIEVVHQRINRQIRQ